MKRNQIGNQVVDPAAIDTMTYSDPSGARKVTEVGRRLLPIPSGGTASTNCTEATALPKAGRNIAVYNNSSTVAAITLGNDNTVTALAVGVVDGNGFVGIPCKANDWTYIACYSNQWVIASSANLLVFLIDDHTSVTNQTKNVVS